MLYLENTQTTGDFTPERQEMLALLSGQIAISLENARLYAHLEQLVAERTAQLAVAEELRALKDRFVSNISHELRTPLNSITNFTYILRTGLRGPLTPGQLDYLIPMCVLLYDSDILQDEKDHQGRLEDSSFHAVSLSMTWHETCSNSLEAIRLIPLYV